jgi:hypothetical protein
MAKISAHNGHTAAQVRRCPEGNPDQWITLTITSDGRLLRKVTFAHRSQFGTSYNSGNNKLVGKVSPRVMALDRPGMEHVLSVSAKNMGYTVPKES